MPQTHESTKENVAVKPRQKLEKPPMYKIFLLNDNYTTMEFVVEILETIFMMNRTQSVNVMLHVHRNGKGLAGVFTFEIAETKVAKVHSLAKENGFPLKCEMEKE